MDYCHEWEGDGDPLEELSKRFKDLRNHLRKTGPKMAAELGISKKTISAIEAEGRSLTRELIQKVCDTYSVDARYFFGQIENPEDADLSKRGEDTKISQTEALTREVREIKEHVISWKPPSKISPEAERVELDSILRNLVRKVMNLRRPLWEKVDSYIDGMTAIDHERANDSAESEPSLRDAELGS